MWKWFFKTSEVLLIPDIERMQVAYGSRQLFKTMIHSSPEHKITWAKVTIRLQTFY